MHLSQTIIRFPEIQLQTRDAHKLRGYFGNLFKEKSELLHNHMGNGDFLYAYPQVQYKVIKGMPMLVGLHDGARLLTELFLKMRELNIDGKIIPVHQKNIEGIQTEIGISPEVYTYRFETLWMGINQNNHRRYEQSDSIVKNELLKRILTGNCLSFFKTMDYFAEERIHMEGVFQEKKAHFKNTVMSVFDGEFRTNLLLPDYIGLGKQVSRGFGTIKRYTY